MKNFRIVLVFGILLFSVAIFSDEIRLSNIAVPGGSGDVTRTGIVLGEDLTGFYEVLFSGIAPESSVPVLSREETNSSESGIGSYDRLMTLYSGKIYSSPEIIEPFVFENKTPEEFIQMKVNVFPDFLEQPFTLYLDLTIQASSHPKEDEISNDAGEYGAMITVTLIKI